VRAIKNLAPNSRDNHTQEPLTRPAETAPNRARLVQAL
jgi:hypothetical protein